jgi:hypothetical protein
MERKPTEESRMSRNALPCIVCNAAVENIDDSFANSPHAATTFETHGHYGSTIFDPMNGSFLVLNVCDKCIERLATEDKILLGQDRKRVVVDNPKVGMPTFVGWLPVKRELTPWRPGTEEDDDLVVDRDAVGDSELYPEIEWHEPAVEYIRSLD